MMPPTKKGRPPNLTLELNAVKRPAHTNTIIELETPVELPVDLLADDDLLQLSSPSSGSSDSPSSYLAAFDGDSDANSDDLSKDLAALERLRRSVHKNLKLRPLRSASVRSFASSSHTRQSSSPPSTAWSESSAEHERHSPSVSGSASPASIYFTPVSELLATPLSAIYTDTDKWRLSSIDVSEKGQPARGIDPAVLVARLSAPARPLLIDTRPVGSFLHSRLDRSINMAIPSLILKRCRKPNGGFHHITALRQYITTEDGKRIWDDMLSSGDWDGDVVLYDENMDEIDRHSVQATAWALLTVMEPLLEHGSADYLEGGLAAARRHPYLRQLIVTDDDADDTSQDDTIQPSRKTGGVFQLDVASAGRSKNLPQVEQSPSSPAPMMPSAIHSWHVTTGDYATPSPPPSQTVFARPPPPRKPSLPTLGRIDTSSAERLNAGMPRLQVRTMPVKSATLAAPPSSLESSSMRARSRSPSHLTLSFSNHSPPNSGRLLSPNGHSSDFLALPSPTYTQCSTPRSPNTPMPRSPSTARADSAQPPTTEEDPYPVFTVSTILPNFLFLGPELTAEDHAEELESLGVRRILNLAFECDDDHGLHLRERFERYVRIPMRDTVEEDNITRGVREVCELLDDARLHSAPTYVHCKAGKSRSVTAVMAYLIHANHWTLSKAYAFVLERRKGISPNIGFVSELMTFEEQELGSKSVGVVKLSPSHTESSLDDAASNGPGSSANYQVALGGRRPQHIRESLPPMFTREHSFNVVPTPSIGDTAAIGDSGQEMEIKDASGRYRHARRAPVDEATLQPMRRVSKAGLESAAYA